ncbi:MAG: tRNA (adenosine(37)-N6)-threonylcarbamoyltransferase complex transferase subunit TsaD [Paludibacteraceae bacterium]|nr:tRNA (adenosine(37)-N6)-threonylcarbamoyltransferase complex transferase subunit TsaD [Paludibacteraceae bacterium]MBP6284208.1 tRNA (adenosine(37)-N6)-threonylcarbamoyltransferase complex transferase subunit TsaD [Paludibacteraceae bacterium]
MDTIILGIESSCDDTSAAVICNGTLVSNVIANQEVHAAYGGVVPELASRAHQQNILPTVNQAIKLANISLSSISAVAYTRGPGLMGSLHVGTSFAKGLALSLGVPLIDVNHLKAHVLVHFINDNTQHTVPIFPFLCLLVSGGNSQIIVVKSHADMEIIGQTMDDAAGEAFDKCAKILGGPYPGGPFVDTLAQQGDAAAFSFNKPRVDGYQYSFSGLKTSFLYLVRDEVKKNPNFIEERKADLCASFQRTVVEILMEKLLKASKEYGISTIALAGGVSANSALRKSVENYAVTYNWTTFVPKFAYTTDNAAMIAIAGMFKFMDKDFSDISLTPFAKTTV